MYCAAWSSAPEHSDVAREQGCDRVNQVGLSQAHATVDEERLYDVPGVQRPAARRRAPADWLSGDKAVEAEFWNEARTLGVRRIGRRRRAARMRARKS